ncbi:MAG: hypothetical protein ACTIC1_05665 [Brevibacterium sp.]|uniref:hypothetical protein n=1 Tax=Brevibacterium aurantiacum TaxID=273384 RepID=UPI003F938EA6
MNEAAINELVAEIDKVTPWVDDAIRETLNHVNAKGLLAPAPNRVDRSEIKKGDWIVYFDADGAPSEFFEALHDGDANYNGFYGECFRVERSLLGKQKPEIKVSDLEPGTHFTGRLFHENPQDWVRLKGDSVLRALTGMKFNATNDDFTVVEVHN